MNLYFAVAIASLAGMTLGAAAVTGLMAQTTPKAYIVTELDVTGDMAVFQRDYAAHVQATIEPYGGRYLVRGGGGGRGAGAPPSRASSSWRACRASEAIHIRRVGKAKRAHV